MSALLLLILKMFGIFFVIGMFTFGGGYAVISLIQTKIVVENAWISESLFTDIIGISQMTPGPIGINCATYVGYEVMRNAGGSHLMGVLGSLSATFAVVLPSFLIVLALVRFYSKFNSSPVFSNTMKILRPAVVGLIAAAALVMIFHVSWHGVRPDFQLIRSNFMDWKSWGLFAAAMFLSFRWKANPMLVILLGALAGFLLYYWQ
ncbi:MAG: chromate transporter [Bacteroidales bacterium]|nr:chromate transporter [Bacteroidales bacterium]